MKTLFQPTVCKPNPGRSDFRPTVCKPNPGRSDFRPTVCKPNSDKNDLLVQRKRNFPTKTRQDAALTKLLTAK